MSPLGSGASRLVFRGRGAGGLRLLPGAFTLAIFEPMHFAMERRMMTNIKELAEGRLPSAARNDLEVVLWTVAFLAVIGAAFAVLRARRIGRALAAFLALGLLFQVLTLVQPHPVLSFVLVFLSVFLPLRRSCAKADPLRKFRRGEHAEHANAPA